MNLITKFEELPTDLAVAVRTNEGIAIRTNNGVEKYPGGRRMQYSNSGDKFAFTDETHINIADSDSGKVLVKIERTKVIYLLWSPKDTLLVSWGRYTTDKETNVGEDNVCVYRTGTGECLYTTVIKRQEGWEPVFTHDDALMGQMYKNEVHFYNTNNFKGGVAKKIRSEGMSTVSVSNTLENIHVAVFAPSIKASPAKVEIYKLDDSATPTASKVFFGSKEVSLLWNAKGDRLLVHAKYDSDGDDKAYMSNEGALYYLSTDGKVTNTVDFAKDDNQLHCVSWSPKMDCFQVLYGHSPAKATLFGANCKPVFEFESSSYRNSGNFNPHGNILCLSGFGNLRGTMEYWDVRGHKVVSRYTAADTTHHEWHGDGVHMLTCTTSPRLRIDNNLIIWHYSGKKLAQVPFDVLLEAKLRPRKGLPSQKAIDPQENTKAAAAPKAYRAPGARLTPRALIGGRIAGGSIVGGNNKTVPGATKAQAPKRLPPGMTAPITSNNRGKWEKNNQVNQQPKNKNNNNKEGAVVKNKAVVTPVVATIADLSSEDVIKKKLRNVKKKQKSIEVLKKKQENGQPLEDSQVLKLKSEPEVLKTIEELEAKLKSVQL